MYRVGHVVTVCDQMQKGYQYTISESVGENFAPTFNPFFSPEEMLKLGIFEGKYCNDCLPELPAVWFEFSRISTLPKPELNYFQVKSRQSLSEWRKRGWIYGPDPRGWFQWYCRYWLGRRIHNLDDIQIGRWRSFHRHAGQIRANCAEGDLRCRPRQRQALLQWSHNPFI